MQIKKLKIGSKIIKTLGQNIRQRQKVQELNITQEIVQKNEIIGDERIHIWVVARKLIVGFRNYLH